jgi:asparagine synthase (glutamine-hydrolysing)
VRYKSDEEYPEHFRLLVEESVRCRLRSTTSVGMMMSGGLDSTSVACLAASMLAPSSLTTLSYVFDELPDCDERQYIDAVTSRWGTRSIQISCDDLWPFRYWPDWPRNPNHPEGNFYRLIKERVYLRAQQEGLRVLLTGGFGDQLYSRVRDWLADLISDRQLGEARKELIRHLRTSGLRRTLEAGQLRRVARRVLDEVTGAKQLPHTPATPRWLTTFATRCLLDNEFIVQPPFDRKGGFLWMREAQSCSREIFHTSRYSLELRHPYRDIRLVEFVLALPAYQFYTHNWYKHILRNAMRGILPEVIRTRPRPTSLESLFSRGMDREKDIFLACLDDPDAQWRNYVADEWLSEHLNTIFKGDGSQGLVPWLCLSYETWYNRSLCY